MRIIVAALVVVIVIVAAGVGWIARFQPIAAIQQPDPESFAGELVDQGDMLVAVGDCVVCHTAPGGEPFSGGLPLETPFGVIYSTNITPDPQTGIGSWSLDAFKRAMHQGVNREGHYLYPAFPFDHFTKVTDADIEAIYSFLMTRKPVSNPAPANELAFPYNQRFLMAGWDLLFLDKGRFEPDPEKSESWNRGAYLAEGLSHCASCHTPRNAFGAENSGAKFQGAQIEGWHAPALDNHSPAPVPWTADALVNYFLDGWDGDHGIAAGPMKEVANALSVLSEDDAYAIADYVLSFQDQDNIEARTKQAQDFADARAFGGSETPVGGPADSGDAAIDAGRDIFARICANCHRSGTNQAPLAVTSSVNAPVPDNVIHIIEEGIRPPEAAYDRSMPAFGGALDDQDMTNLVAFVRSHFSSQPAWTDIADKVKSVRGGTEKMAEAGGS